MKRLLVREEKFKITDYVFMVISCVNLGIFIFSSDFMGNTALFSLLARGLILLNLAVFGPAFLKKRSKKEIRLLVVLGFMALFGVITYLSHRTMSVIDFGTILLGYLAVPIYVVSVEKIKFNTYMIKWFRVIAVVYAGYFIFRGFITPTYREGTGALLLGYGNSNTTGAYMFLVSIFVLLAFNNAQKRLHRLFSYGVVTILLYLIVRTQCRSAFILTLACLVYAVFPKIYRPKKIAAIVCVMAPIMFYYFYLYLYRASWKLDMTILDRTIYSGRQITFIAEGLRFDVLGDFASLFEGLNVYIAVVNTLGVIGFILFLLFYGFFLTSPTMQSYKGVRYVRRNLPLFCFCAVMLHGCVETALFTGGTVFAGVLGCILAVIVCNNQEVLRAQEK